MVNGVEGVFSQSISKRKKYNLTLLYLTISSGLREGYEIIILLSNCSLDRILVYLTCIRLF